MSINAINGNTALESGFFPPCRAATTDKSGPLADGNIVLEGLQTIDNVVLAGGDRVLVKDQANPVENGIYSASTGVWVRSSDARGNQQFFDGMAVIVSQGAANAGMTFVCTCTDDPVVVGTSLLTFASQSAVADAQQTATSTSSHALSVGAKTFAIDAGKNFSAKQWLDIYETANPDNGMLAQITSYVGASLVVNVVAVGGAGGPYTDWTLVLTNTPPAAGRQPPVGFGNMTGPSSSTVGHLAVYADPTGKVLADGGAAGALANKSLVGAVDLAFSAVSNGGSLINGQIVHSRAGGAETVAIKTLAGNDPSALDPVIAVFRDTTANLGDATPVLIIAPTSITIPSTKGLGFPNGLSGKFWTLMLNVAGTVELAVINCLKSGNIYPLGGWGIISTLAVSGATLGAQPYSTTARNNVPFAVIASSTWENGLTAAGTWDAAPTKVQPFVAGVKLPGEVVQTQWTPFGNVATGGSGNLVSNDTVPQITQGDEFMTQPITPSSGANILEIDAQAYLSVSNSAVVSGALFQDAKPAALAAGTSEAAAFAVLDIVKLFYVMRADTTIQTTFRFRGGGGTGTTTFNGQSAARVFGGVMNSFMRVVERVA